MSLALIADHMVSKGVVVNPIEEIWAKEAGRRSIRKHQGRYPYA